MSLALRSGVPIETIIDQAHSIRPCNAFIKKDGTSKGTSCASAIGYALAEINERIQNTLNICGLDEDEGDTETIIEHSSEGSSGNNECPECGSHLIFEGGCVVCKNCGWSRCG